MHCCLKWNTVKVKEIEQSYTWIKNLNTWKGIHPDEYTLSPNSDSSLIKQSWNRIHFKCNATCTCVCTWCRIIWSSIINCEKIKWFWLLLSSCSGLFPDTLDCRRAVNMPSKLALFLVIEDNLEVGAPNQLENLPTVYAFIINNSLCFEENILIK